MNHHLLYQWETEIGKHMPQLNSWQLANVALFSQGIIQDESCEQGKVARQLVVREQVSSFERRWRRFLANEPIDEQAWQQRWSRWIGEALQAPLITLIVDETKLQDRFGIMVVGIAWEQRSIPLAWRVYEANEQGSYPPEGQVEMIGELLLRIKEGVGATQAVLLLADRGIGNSPSLCQVVANLGW